MIILKVTLNKLIEQKSSKYTIRKKNIFVINKITLNVVQLNKFVAN